MAFSLVGKHNPVTCLAPWGSARRDRIVTSTTTSPKIRATVLDRHSSLSRSVHRYLVRIRRVIARPRCRVSCSPPTRRHSTGTRTHRISVGGPRPCVKTSGRPRIDCYRRCALGDCAHSGAWPVAPWMPRSEGHAPFQHKNTFHNKPARLPHLPHAAFLLPYAPLLLDSRSTRSMTSSARQRSASTCAPPPEAGARSPPSSCLEGA